MGLQKNMHERAQNTSTMTVAQWGLWGQVGHGGVTQGDTWPNDTTHQIESRGQIPQHMSDQNFSNELHICIFMIRPGRLSTGPHHFGLRPSLEEVGGVPVWVRHTSKVKGYI